MLKTYLKRNLIFINPSVSTKEELYSFIANKVKGEGLIQDEKKFIKVLLERDQRNSSNIIENVALPHAKCDTINELFVCMAIFNKGISLSGREVNIVICLGSSERDYLYLALFADITRLLTKKAFVEGLRQAQVVEDVITIVSRHSIEEYIKRSKQKPLYQMVLVLNKVIDNNLLSEILLEAGLHCLYEISSEKYLTKNFRNIPFLCCDMRSMLDDNINSRIIMGVSNDENVASKIYTLLKEEEIDMEAPGTGIIYTTPLLQYYGGIDEDIDF